MRYIASPVKTVKIVTTVVSPQKAGQSPVKLKLVTDPAAVSGSSESHAPPPVPKPKKTGSLGLFFRKVRKSWYKRTGNKISIPCLDAPKKL